MQGGDISNRLPPRWLIVFEGVIGRHPEPSDIAAYEMYRKIRAHRRALMTFKPDDHTRKVLWDLTWRRDYKFDVATFLPYQTAKHVAGWLEHYNVPAVNTFIYESPFELGKQLAYMPDVRAVVHAAAENRFTYGDRGMLVTEGWTA